MLVLGSLPMASYAQDLDVSFYAWGNNTYSELGDGTTVDQATPKPIASVTFMAISTGENFACGLDSSSRTYCWGFNNAGNLGTGDQDDQSTPAAVLVPNGVTFAALSAGVYMSCAVATTGDAYCWGDDTFGQLGNGLSISGSFTPVSVSMPSGVAFTQVASGDNHTCALTTTGSAYCWGSGSRGKLGNGSTSIADVPVAVVMPSGVNFSQIVAAERATCALSTTGQAYCWGDNGSGQLGDGTGTNASTPQAVSMPAGVSFDSLVAGGEHVCGIVRGASMHCWGDNFFGQLGIGNTTDQLTPQLVPASSSFSPVGGYAGLRHTCAVNASGDAYCWGRNDDGQLGIGNTTNQSTPQLVTGSLKFSSFASGSISNSTYALPLRPATGDQVPSAAMQQFARAESDTCEMQPEDLVDFPALGHVKHLNWGQSWAQWPNGGTGGFVCTRQPYYTSADTWNVR